jgi:hypothetical protein
VGEVADLPATAGRDTVSGRGKAISDWVEFTPDGIRHCPNRFFISANAHGRWGDVEK